MKTSKLLITSLLAAAAMGANAFADTSSGTLLPELTSINRLGGGSTVTNGTYTNPVKIANDSINASNVAGDLKTNCTALQTQGWYWGIGQAKAPDGDNPYGNDVSKSETGTGFVFYSRPAYSGEYVATAVDLTSLLGENAADMKTELSISFDIVGEAQISGASFSIWSWDGSSDTATEIYKDTSAVTTTVRSVSVTTNPLLLGSGKLLVVWNAGKDGGGKTVTVSNLASSYTASTYSTLYWRGGDATWSTDSTTWSTDRAAGSGDVAATSFDDVIFDSSETVAVDSAGVAVDKLTISAGTVSFTGGTITATGGVSVTGGTLSVLNSTTLGTNKISLSGGTLQAGAANLSLANAVDVSAASGIDTNGKNLTLTGQLTGSGTLTKTGTGTLYVSGRTDNAFTGTLHIQEGTVWMGGSNTRGDSSLTNTPHGAKILVERDATILLNMGGASTAIDFNGDFYLKDGSTIKNRGGFPKLVGDIVFGATDTAGAFSATANVVFAQEWGKTIGLAGKIFGAGMVELQNASGDDKIATYKISGFDNSFSGTYKLTGALVGDKERLVKLQLTTQTAAKNASVNLTTQYASLELGTSAVDIAGLAGAAGSSVRLVSGTAESTLTVNQATNTTFSGTIADGIALKKAGAGTLILNGDNSANRSGVTLSAGTLELGHNNALGGGVLTIQGTGTQAPELKLGTDASRNALTISNNFSLVGTVKVSSAHDGNKISGSITAFGAEIRKIGSGTLTLSGTNTDSSIFTVDITEGKIIAGSNTALGATLAAEYSGFAGYHKVRLSGGQLEVGSGVTLAQTNIEIVLSDAYSSTAAITGDGALATGATITIADIQAAAIAAESALGNDSWTFQIATEGSTIADSLEKENFVLAEALQGTWQISGYANGMLTITIPEPSVFGLLAGLGALALAGTRRRRKKA